MRVPIPAPTGRAPTPSTRRTVHLFPGQGDFSPGPLVRATRPGGPLRRHAEEVYGLLDRVTAECGLPALAPWLLGPAPPTGRELAVAPTGTSQLAAFGASMTVHQAMVSRHGAPDALLGVSFGEIAALCAAGVYTITDGARIAHDLARILTSCPGGLTLLVCPEDTAAGIAERAAVPGTVVACANDDRETIVSGPLAALDAVESDAAALGIGAVRLRLPFSSHHPDLAPQAEQFTRAVRKHPVRPARCTVYSAVAGRAYGAGEDFARALADCLVRPARLPDVLRAATGSRPQDLYEAGTGSALSRSAGRILAGRPDTFVHAPLADDAFRW